MSKLIYYFLVALLLIFPFGQLTRVGLNLGGQGVMVNLYLFDLTISLIVFTGLFRWRELLRTPVFSPLLAFSSVLTLSFLVALPRFPLSDGVVAGAYLVRWLTYAFFLLALTASSLVSKKARFWLLVAGSLAGLFGLGQYLLWPDTRILFYLGWDDHYYRNLGLFFDPNFNGIILVLTLILLTSFPYRLGLVILGVCVYLSLILTFSRSAYIALFVAALFFIIKRKKYRVKAVWWGFGLAVTALTLASVIILSPAGEGGNLGRSVSTLTRIRSWQHAGEIIRRHPWLGVGYNYYRFAQRDEGFLGTDWRTNHAGAGVDSSLLFVAATAGILGLLAYLWLWLTIFTTGDLAVKTSVVAVFTHSFFNNTLFYPWVVIWMWVLIASRQPSEKITT